MARRARSLPFAQVRQRLAALPVPLREHVERVASEAVALARRHHVDQPAAEFAALAHDVFRAESPWDLLQRARSYAIPLDSIEEAMPVLVHGAVTAEWLRRQLGVQDEGILNAVRYHTTGRPGMSRLEMVVFLADKTEPGREGEYPNRDQVRDLASRDMEGAVLRFLEAQTASWRAAGLSVHPDSEATLSWLRARRR